MDNICFVFVGIHLLFSIIKFSTAIDAITQTQFVSDGSSLTSKDGSFKLGFFSPANSSYRFLGIWNRKIPLRTVSWVANVHKPINDSSGILMINSSGNAVILSQNTTVVWYTSSSKQAVNPILQLLDSGKLVLRDGKDGNSGIFLWQSFDHPIGTVGLSARRVSLSASEDACDSYGHCGAYGVCTISELQVCKCLKGFKPISPETWEQAEYRQGCERNKTLKCQNNNGFIKYVGLKLPDTKNAWVSQGMDMKECKAKCLGNCSCIAFASSDAKGGSTCTIWFSDLIDIRRLLNGGGQDLYVRMPASELETHNGVKVKIAVIIIVVVSIVCGLLLSAYCIRRNRKMSKGQTNKGQEEDLELPLFNLSTIASATDNFSFNKLGQGGFGTVYRGALMDGQEIAVKRLSEHSGQGSNEFKNEVILIAKLQHRNLVRLLGYCIQGEEKLLIYEYIPTKAWTSIYLIKHKILEWQEHLEEIKQKESQRRVAGTLGYMAPEYAIDGQFSVNLMCLALAF
nr:G-type lectin S-receptor-like serine/threonine-protein kinase At4g27290 [Ziziphus jujuba var. spinosa]